jgi:sulfur-oxidizing protein SoxB
MMKYQRALGSTKQFTSYTRLISMLLFMACLPFFAVASGSQGAMEAGDEDVLTSVTLIQIGDIHGHLIPRPNLRYGGPGGTEGGLARLYTVVQSIRERSENSILFNTGDTIQGSAEALHTRGQALVDVVSEFDVDFYAPGNWDYLYGTERFIELFAPGEPLAPWNGLAANLTYDGAPYADKSGQTVLPPYAITTIAGIKFGILGFTAERGPMVVGPDVARGFKYTKGDEELAALLPKLREVEKVDIVVMISELGEANNMRLAENHPGIDIVLSSDMHEETREAVISSTGTMVVEMGQDGTRVGELTVTFNADNGIVEKSFKMHRVDDSVTPDERIAAIVEKVRAPFISGTFVPHVNPISGVTLNTPIDSVVGKTKIDLHRSNFADAPLPAVIEGSSHDFISEAFRVEANTDLGLLRGFRYGTHIAPGDIRLEDLYHYIPVGPFVAVGEMSGQQIQKNLEKIAEGSLSPVSENWTGGWLHSWSGLTYDLDPYNEMGKRITNIHVYDREQGQWVPLDPDATFTVAGYNYATEPNKINKLPAQNVRQLGENGQAIEATQMLINYLSRYPADPQTGRINILQPMPPPVWGNKELQPLHGVSR